MSNLTLKTPSALASAPTQQTIQIATKHPATLAATVFRPDTIKAAVMIAPATGIKRQFYQNFAQYLMEHGYGVISYDNEDIGESMQGDLKHSNASLISWGRYDMTTVLDRLIQEFPNTTYHLVGHSAGGQLFGLMPNHDKLTSVFNVACSSGQIPVSYTHLTLPTILLV